MDKGGDGLKTGCNCNRLLLYCGAVTGEFLPLQLIYQGSACLPRYKFLDVWHVTCTLNHWSNEDKN